jgi:hypothetical protein
MPSVGADSQHEQREEVAMSTTHSGLRSEAGSQI